MKSTVAILSCDAYEPALLDAALEHAAAQAGFPDVRGLSVLVKPNLLNASPPEKAVTTHPEFVAAIIRLLKRRGAARILVGDSPGWQRMSMAANVAGLSAAALQEGAEMTDFSTGALRASPSGTLVRHFTLAAVLNEVDLVVNLPKLKTHRLMHYTGAIKNLFGLIPGMAKSAMHVRFPSTDAFGTMLNDLSGAVGPVFSFMDAIVAMEGEGPGSGDPRHLGLIFASNCLAALDYCAAETIGYKASSLAYIAEGLRRAGHNPEAPDIDYPGLNPASIKLRDFKLIDGVDTQTSFFQLFGKLPATWRSVVGEGFAMRPCFDAKKCIGCAGCVHICPAKALDLRKNRSGRHQVRIDDSVCILCYCCHEVCPAKAIDLARVLFRAPSRSRKAHKE